jgi:hypothetical protein
LAVSENTLRSQHDSKCHKSFMSCERNPEMAVSLGRHRRTCFVCRHTQREEIEADFVGWRSPSAIAEEYGLADRASVYRHAHVLGLFGYFGEMPFDLRFGKPYGCSLGDWKAEAVKPAALTEAKWEARRQTQFNEHVRQRHSNEDVNQTAARIIREATED